MNDNTREKTVGEENQQEISQDILQTLTEIMANLLDCEVSELKEKGTQEDLIQILQVLTERRYDDEEIKKILISLRNIGILIPNQVDEAMELLLYIPK